jgi:hypothetical protein
VVNIQALKGSEFNLDLLLNSSVKTIEDLSLSITSHLEMMLELVTEKLCMSVTPETMDSV